MREIKLLLFLLPASYFLLVSSYAAALPIKSSVEVSKSSLKIGEPAEYKIALEYPGNYTVSMPDPSDIFEKLEVIDKKLEIPTKSSARKMSKALILYKITGYEPGEYFTKEFEISLVDGDTVRKIPIGKIKIVIEDLKPSAADTDDIRDIKPPLWPASHTALFVVFFALAVLAAAYYYSKKKRKVPFASTSSSEEKIDPSKVALEKLEALLLKNLLAEGKIKEFYIELSEIFRIFLAEKYGIPVIERTTSELYRSMKGLVDKKYNLSVKEFLENCDMVKFAEYLPAEDEIKKDVEKMKGLI